MYKITIKLAIGGLPFTWQLSSKESLKEFFIEAADDSLGHIKFCIEDADGSRTWHDSRTLPNVT